MHYFVDGYNLLFRSRFPHDVFQKQRDQVITDLADAVGTLGLNLTVVFDSTHTTELSTRQHKGPLEIVYTDGKDTADRLILRALEDCPAVHRETVITSDKPLAEAARRLGAKTMDVESFLNWLRARYRTKSKKAEKLAWVTAAAKAKPPITPVKAPATTPIKPQTKAPPAPSSHDYLAIFEQRLQEASEHVITREGGNERAQSQPKKPKRKPRATKEAPEPDHDRWLRLFEARRDEEE